MATILEFRALPGRSQGKPIKSRDAGPCQIVIFPGIRVAYWDDLAPSSDDAPPPPRSASRKGARQKRPKG